MTQHTAQHLLSALLDTHFSLPTLSWALPAHPSTDACYVELPRGLSKEEIEKVEGMCNELVTREWGAKARLAEKSGKEEGGGDTRVWIESRLQGQSSVAQSGTVTPAQADAGEVPGDVQKEMEGLGLSSGTEGGVVEYGDRESRGLPKDYEGVSRYLEIETFGSQGRTLNRDGLLCRAL
jgi:hypothetical protein